MKMEIEVPEYSKEHGLKYEWELGFTLECTCDNNQVVIKANSEGLVSLARHLLLLSQKGVPAGCHIHLDAYNALEEGSCELIITKI